MSQAALKVLLTGPEWFGDLLPYCEDGLREMGHDVRRLPVNQAPGLDEWRAKWNRFTSLPFLGPKIAHRLRLATRNRLRTHVQGRFRELVGEFRPDVLVALVCWGDPLTADVLAQSGIPRRLGWLMDDPFLDDASTLPAMSHYDALFSVDRSWAPPLRQLTGRPVHTLVCGADPKRHTQVPRDAIPERMRSKICFVGSSYRGVPAGLSRHSILTPLVPHGLRVYGDSGWKQEPAFAGCFGGGPFATAETNLAYNGGEIVLNIHHPQFRADTSLRTFAITATGACQLVDWRPGIEEYFVPDEEIVVYQDATTATAAAERLLKDAALRQRIGEAARRRTLAEHTYAHRFHRMFQLAAL
jgi:spore maturation protein CgeB